MPMNRRAAAILVAPEKAKLYSYSSGTSALTLTIPASTSIDTNDASDIIAAGIAIAHTSQRRVPFLLLTSGKRYTTNGNIGTR